MVLEKEEEERPKDNCKDEQKITEELKDQERANLNFLFSRSGAGAPY